MKRFARLVVDLEAGRQPERVWSEYLIGATESDVMRAIALVTGRDARRHLSAQELLQFTRNLVRLPDWLFERSCAESEDAAESSAMLVTLIASESESVNDETSADPSTASNPSDSLSLSETFEQLLAAIQSPESTAVELWLNSIWLSIDETTRVVLNRILLGSCPCRVRESSLLSALAAKYQVPVAAIAQRISLWSPGRWHRANAQDFFELIAECENRSDWEACPWQPILQLTSELQQAMAATPEFSKNWCAEWKWDGVRVQLVRGIDQVLWHVADLEPLAGKLPEVSAVAERLPPKTILEGVLVAGNHETLLSSERLMSRLDRRRPTPKDLAQTPVSLIVTDLLQHAGDDLRNRAWETRRKHLERLFVDLDLSSPTFALSDVYREAWHEVQQRHQQSRRSGISGLILKSLHEPYGSVALSWLSWRSSSLSFFGTLIHVRKTGDGGSMYEATFAVASDTGLVTLARTPLGFENPSEQSEFEAFVKRTTVEKFGPVRTLQPERVYEIQISAAVRSNRHRSGIAVRDATLVGWQADRQVSEISQLDQLREAWGLAMECS